MQDMKKEISTNRAQLIRKNTVLCKRSVDIFEEKLKDKLFPNGKKYVQWKDLYYIITTFRIITSETAVWNLFLDDQRKAIRNVDKNDSLLFSKKDITRHRVQWLFNMSESYKTWRKKPKVYWKMNLVRAMFTGKFLMGNGCNFFVTLLIFVTTLLLLTVAVFPVGEGLVDTFLICQIGTCIYAAGCLWYFLTLLGEN